MSMNELEKVLQGMKTGKKFSQRDRDSGSTRDVLRVVRLFVEKCGGLSLLAEIGGGEMLHGDGAKCHADIKCVKLQYQSY